MISPGAGPLFPRPEMHANCKGTKPTQDLLAGMFQPCFLRTFCHRRGNGEKPSAQWDSVYRVSWMKNSPCNVSRSADYKCSSPIRGEALMERKKDECSRHNYNCFGVRSVIVMVSYTLAEVLTKAVYCSCPLRQKSPPHLMIQESHFPAPNDCERRRFRVVMACFIVNKREKRRDEEIIPRARIRDLEHKQKRD